MKIEENRQTEIARRLEEVERLEREQAEAEARALEEAEIAAQTARSGMNSGNNPITEH